MHNKDLKDTSNAKAAEQAVADVQLIPGMW